MNAIFHRRKTVPKGVPNDVDCYIIIAIVDEITIAVLNPPLSHLRMVPLVNILSYLFAFSVSVIINRVSLARVGDPGTVVQNEARPGMEPPRSHHRARILWHRPVLSDIGRV